MPFQKLNKQIIINNSVHSTHHITKSPECIAPSAFDDNHRNSSAKVGIFNLISTMIGGGVLSLPYAVSRSGLVLGFILLTISAIISVFSFDILVSSSRRTGAMTYQQIAFTAFGKNISLFITFLIWALTYLASIGYCVLVGDLFKPCVCYLSGMSDEQCASEWLRRGIITAGILCVSPFCYMRQSKSLKFTSAVSVTAVCILAVIILGITASHFGEEHEIYYINGSGASVPYTLTTNIKLFPETLDDVIYVFPVFGISFMCHFNLPQVHSELTRPTRKRVRIMLISVAVVCYILYSTVAFFGYFYSFEYTCGNILLNYDQNSALVSLARLCLGLVILLSFPLLILPARASLHNLLNLFFSFKSMNLENYDNDVDSSESSMQLEEEGILSHTISEEEEEDVSDSHKRSYAIQRKISSSHSEEEEDEDEAQNINALKSSKGILLNITPFSSFHFDKSESDQIHRNRMNNFNKKKSKNQVKQSLISETDVTQSIHIPLHKPKASHSNLSNLTLPKSKDSSSVSSPLITRDYSLSRSKSHSRLKRVPVPLTYNTFNSNTSSTHKLKHQKHSKSGSNNSSQSKSMGVLKNKFQLQYDDENTELSKSARSTSGRVPPALQPFGNFTTRSFSQIDSPLRGPSDALGIINEPSDIHLLRNQDFAKHFADLQATTNYTPTDLWLYGETTIMIGLSLMVAFVTESIMVIWGLAGSTVTFIIAFTLPGFFYFRIRKKKGCTLRRYTSLTLAILSMFAVVFCTWQAVTRLSIMPCSNQPPAFPK